MKENKEKKKTDKNQKSTRILKTVVKVYIIVFVLLAIEFVYMQVTDMAFFNSFVDDHMTKISYNTIEEALLKEIPGYNSLKGEILYQEEYKEWALAIVFYDDLIYECQFWIDENQKYHKFALGGSVVNDISNTLNGYSIENRMSMDLWKPIYFLDLLPRYRKYIDNNFTFGMVIPIICGLFMICR